MSSTVQIDSMGLNVLTDVVKELKVSCTVNYIGARSGITLASVIGIASEKEFFNSNVEFLEPLVEKQNKETSPKAQVELSISTL